MTEATRPGFDEVVAARRHIIRRPRLESLLNDTTAQVILLVAPAGYGKTTLARQWLEDKPHAWCQATPASADVAALAESVAEAIEIHSPGAGDRLRERLRATAGPPPDPAALAELLATNASLPGGIWLALDDYHFAVPSRESEEFVEALAELLPAGLLVASRSTPTWATARRIIYHEVRVLGQTDLALTEDEAAIVARQLTRDASAHVFHLSGGWPAVIGLASLIDWNPDDDAAIPDDLYVYFAEELLQHLPESVRQDLYRISLLPNITSEVVESLLPEGHEETVDLAIRHGVLNPHRRRFELHPLLRRFLEDHLRAGDPVILNDALQQAVRVLLSQRLWDDALTLVESHRDPILLEALIQAALEETLSSGRLQTVQRWVELSKDFEPSGPFDLAEASLSFRLGEYERAEALARRATRALPADEPLLALAYIQAGLAAHLNDRPQACLRYCRLAERMSMRAVDTTRARWGQLIAALEQELADSADYLSRYAELPNADDLSVVQAELMLARNGNVREALENARTTPALADRTKDPVRATAYLNTLSNVLCTAGHFQTSLDVAYQELEKAREFGLDFVFPHALTNMAEAQIGLREFVKADEHLRQARELDSTAIGGFLDLNIRIIEARSLLAQGRSTDAAELLRPDSALNVTPGVEAELLAIRSLALAAASDFEQALDLACRAVAKSRMSEVRLLARCVDFLARQDEVNGRTTAIAAVADTFRATGCANAIVATARVSLTFLESLVAIPSMRVEVAEILRLARDHDLASKVGLQMPPAERRDPEEALTPREREVCSLVTQGLTNREIAKALFISEVTVKVHLRHIFEKLGARSRTEVAVRALALERSRLGRVRD